MLFAAACLALLAGPPDEIPAPLLDVVKMAAQGYTEETIVAYVRATQTHVPLTPSLRRQLRGLGVRDAVLEALDPRPLPLIIARPCPPPPPGPPLPWFALRRRGCRLP